jgi:hypothetical protein
MQLQLLANHIAALRESNVDMPHNLTKRVTVEGRGGARHHQEEEDDDACAAAAAGRVRMDAAPPANSAGGAR